MLPRLVSAKHAGEYRLVLRFSDGVEGEVDLGDELWGAMFEPLADVSAFSQARLDEELGTVVWPNGADFAPEFLYQKLRPAYSLGAKTSGAA